ncbi:5'-AMP-activated protein kinase subunit beta-1 isoform X1 [Anopheles ziemanni]|uniref:5'-AMP-activated protein kinase subunit beta-1 isoform X1 n=1 Tax=Anopheles coustani TaxID=139045 RepID=UPI00265B31E4|nr:5'-AMP-activated protein kinase subunit beta-1 isoform X1 [Anopheles coustani]XP_058167473.1 5'-AMP-activated protein kinase subunit beta-1 isoform X1 [Anopheles ziemanni]
MGNAGSNLPRERHKSGSNDPIPGSPMKDDQAFVFDRKPVPMHGYPFAPEEEGGPYAYSKSVPEPEFTREPRQRSNTMSEGTTPTDAPSGTAGQQEDGIQSETVPTVFKWDGGGKQVYISGTFSEWKALPMVKSHGDFVTIVNIPEGDHQYKFLVDGEWKHDPKLKNVENDTGITNNLVTVRQSDFEVFQALAKDSEDTGKDESKEWGQDIPTARPWGKESGPPVLPPHLLQVILNKDTPLSCEPTLLPEPNHVMLNHLYALSIKDGVMVLSATHRYRKKYVTTLLYKPI